MTKPLVIDASAAAAWLLASQSTQAAQRLLMALDDYDLLAPHIFQWEIGNLLVRQSSRDRGFQIAEAFERLDDYEIRIAPPSGWEKMRHLARLAQLRRLSLFDASYLWLAISADATLASRDADLLAAAEDAGLALLDLRDPH